MTDEEYEQVLSKLDPKVAASIREMNRQDREGHEQADQIAMALLLHHDREWDEKNKKAHPTLNEVVVKAVEDSKE